MAGISLIVVPDEDDPDCAEVMVDGSIGGHPYRFVLDTGAARTHVVADAYTETLPRHGADSSSGIFAASTHGLVTLPGVTVGPITTPQLEVLLVETPSPAARNLLGMDVLRHHCCHFQFDTGTLVVEPSGRIATAEALHLDPVSHPYVTVRWGGVAASAVWDSGAGITVIDERFWRSHPSLFRAAGTSVGTDATGAQRNASDFIMDGAEIGGHRFAAHRVAVVDLSRVNAGLARPMDIIVGYTTYRQANWLFDFPARRWSITRGPT